MGEALAGGYIDCGRWDCKGWYAVVRLGFIDLPDNCAGVLGDFGLVFVIPGYVLMA